MTWNKSQPEEAVASVLGSLIDCLEAWNSDFVLIPPFCPAEKSGEPDDGGGV